MSSKKGAGKRAIAGAGQSKEEKNAIRRRAKVRARRWHRMISPWHMCIGAVVFGLIAGGLSYSGVLEGVDHLVSDMVYKAVNRKLDNSPVRIISIDKKTVDKYGEYQNWSRDKTVELLDRLNQTVETAPGAIGLDMQFSEEKDSEGDQALVEACGTYKNICFSAYAARVEQLFGLEFKEDYDLQYIARTDDPAEEQLIAMVEPPFESLLEQATVGIVNNVNMSEDGIVRNAFSSVKIDGVEIDSFATVIYKMYMDSKGTEYTLPKMDEGTYFQFTFSKTSQEYTVYSFCDVLEGKIAPAAFAGGIVLVSSYLDDSMFDTPYQHGEQMHEMEMQVNLIEALLEQRTGQEASRNFVAIFYAFFIALFFIATSYSSMRLTIIIAALVGVAQFFACWIVNLFGYYVNILVPLLMAVVISVYNLVMRNVLTMRKQYAMEEVFRKYVDESVVTELEKDGRIEARIGVVRKDVAVLFVDIRGFTSLSECLAPEQIVVILNAYLGLVAQAVAKYKGTLDKFIGDAAMAVFNSPTDLDDYEFRAVCAALELRASASDLNEKCKKEFGKQVSFGIGIQCGEAVIGNIGCERRMDYTAIGDTVNTASRLEGVAAPGQILIGMELMQRLQGRIQTSFAGDFKLKGKRHAVPAYLVEGIAQADKMEAGAS